MSRDEARWWVLDWVEVGPISVTDKGKILTRILHFVTDLFAGTALGHFDGFDQIAGTIFISFGSLS